MIDTSVKCARETLQEHFLSGFFSRLSHFVNKDAD